MKNSFSGRCYISLEHTSGDILSLFGPCGSLEKAEDCLRQAGWQHDEGVSGGWGVWRHVEVSGFRCVIRRLMPLGKLREAAAKMEAVGYT